MAAFCLTLAPIAHAAAQQASAATPPDLQAKFQQAAQKSCNDDLDRNHFGAYASIEDCVADKADRMERAYRANPTASQAAATTTARRPN
ncbi:MAG: hypothetical protein WDN04_17145 [Rhodospirillales bacterium]